MSDSTKAITPELIDALVKALEPKLEELVETQVKKVLAEGAANSTLQKVPILLSWWSKRSPGAG